jgi:hypothetical protein
LLTIVAESPVEEPASEVFWFFEQPAANSETISDNLTTSNLGIL